MKQQGFCLSGCPPLSFLRSSPPVPLPTLPPSSSPRWLRSASPVAPSSPFFITFAPSPPSAAPSATPRHPSLRRASLLAPAFLAGPLRPCNNARVYTVCPHPLAYIFASYNIDYFGRISGRAARAETVSPTRTTAPRQQPLREQPSPRVRPAFSQSLSLSTPRHPLLPSSNHHLTSQCRLFAFAFGDSRSISTCRCILRQQRYRTAMQRIASFFKNIRMYIEVLERK